MATDRNFTGIITQFCDPALLVDLVLTVGEEGPEWEARDFSHLVQMTLQHNLASGVYPSQVRCA